MYLNRLKINFIVTANQALAQSRSSSSGLLQDSVELERWRQRHTFEFTNYIRSLRHDGFSFFRR